MSTLLSIFGDNPVYGLIAVTLICAMVLHMLLNLKEPAKDATINRSTFDSMVEDGDWAEEEVQEGGQGAGGAGAVGASGAAAAAAAAAARDLPTPTTATATAVPGDKPRPKKINAGPFNIGDRVVLKGLVGAKHLNGRHGTIADLWDKKTQRYPVDLDLLEPKKASVSVKPGNLSKEPSVPDEMESDRAKVVGGCLEESHARAVSFIFMSMRGSIANSLGGEKDPRRIADWGWHHWRNPQSPGQGVYPTLRTFLKEGVVQMNGLEKMEQQLNPTNPKGAYKLVQDSMDDVRAVGGWNVRVHGEFWIVAMNKEEGTLVVPANNTRAVYKVLGLKQPLGAEAVGKFPRPPKFNLTLVSWYGRLVHDPLLTTTTGTNRVEVASPQLTAKLMESVKLAQEEGRILDRLPQLEVPDGSREGVPFVASDGGKGGGGGVTTMMPQGPPPKQDPPTDQEKKLVDNLTEFEPFPLSGPQPTTPEDHAGAWNFIRKAENEAENPKHEGVIVTASGHRVGEFKSKDLVPTAVEVLLALLVTIAKPGNGKRPSIVGVDDPTCFARLQFLLKDVRGTRVFGLNVKRNPGPRPPPGAMQQQGPPKKQEPADEGELSLIDNVADFEPCPLSGPQPRTPEEQSGAWNFIRKGETEAENPNREGVVLTAAGQKIGEFRCREVKPTAREVLKSMLGIAAKRGNRPSILGVDDPDCCARLQFLLKDISGTKVLGLNVQRNQGGPPPPGASAIPASVVK